MWHIWCDPLWCDHYFSRWLGGWGGRGGWVVGVVDILEPSTFQKYSIAQNVVFEKKKTCFLKWFLPLGLFSILSCLHVYTVHCTLWSTLYTVQSASLLSIFIDRHQFSSITQFIHSYPWLTQIISNLFLFRKSIIFSQKIWTFSGEKKLLNPSSLCISSHL